MAIDLARTRLSPEPTLRAACDAIIGDGRELAPRRMAGGTNRRLLVDMVGDATAARRIATPAGGGLPHHVRTHVAVIAATGGLSSLARSRVILSGIEPESGLFAIMFQP